MKVGALLAIAIGLAACGGAAPVAYRSSTPGATATSSPISSSPAAVPPASPLTMPTPIPQGDAPKPIPFTCTSPIRARASLALVTLNGSTDVVVRDITDLAHPVTRCAFKSCFQSCDSFGPDSIRFLDRTHVSYKVNDGRGGNAIYVADLAARTSSLYLWLKPEGTIDAFAWKPDRSALAYLAPTDTAVALHELSAGGDRIVATVPQLPGVGCEQQCAGQDTWEVSLAYSPDGTQLSLSESVVHYVFRVWTADGRLLEQNDTQARWMPVWAGNGLFFNAPGGVAVWRDRTIAPFLSGTVWIRPNASADGTEIVYGTRDSSGWVHSVIAEVSTGKTFELGRGRSEPVFLTSRYIWYAGDRACVPADNCAAFPTTASGTTYIYDLLNRNEAVSIITGVADVWPHQGVAA